MNFPNSTDRGIARRQARIKAVIINQRRIDWAGNRITYDQLCMLAHSSRAPGGAVITFFRGPKSRPEGSLHAGESVTLKNGMSFTVVRTNRA